MSDEPAQHTLTILTNSLGTQTGAGTYNVGDNVSISATPNSAQHQFQKWEVISGGISIPTSSSDSFSMPANDVELQAVYESAVSFYAVTQAAGNNGSISGASSINLSAGQTLNLAQFSPTPAAGYEFDTWGTSAGGSFASPDSTSAAVYTFGGTSNVTLTANFKAIAAPTSYDITLSSDSNGSNQNAGSFAAEP